ncbi:hypothetical protein ALC56_12605 [Trachymyrmex septentrionalis]|uniref:Uncharacterized protein n=1 Tax=Trachymyrmex septentrionalis TaxID=34720 RepID=A0A195EY28_9HYME|nr:hypothetical protein ALC56_12605 [Trachymyrmex septentrionalis]
MSAKFLKRHEAVFLVNHAKGPKLTCKAAAKYIRKSEAFVKKWVQQYLEIGNVDDLPERGLSRATTTKENKAILRLFLFIGNLNAEKMCTIYQKYLLKSAEKLYGFDRRNANPIENVWSYMKMKLKGKPVYTVKQLSFQIKKIWRSLPKEYVENLVERNQRLIRGKRLLKLYDFITPNLWPPSSPDLNLLDYYVWGVVEWETNKHPHNTISSLKDAITTTMINMNKEHLIRGCSRFRSRIESVIAANGDFIE